MPWIFSDNDSHLPPAVGPGGYAGEVLADNPFIYYRLDETSTPSLSTGTIIDSSGNNRHADIYVSVASVSNNQTGPGSSKAYKMEKSGAVDYAYFPWVPPPTGYTALSDSAEFSIEFWHKTNGNPGDVTEFFAAGQRISVGSSTFVNYGIQATTGYNQFGDATHNYSLASDNAWHQYVYTKKKSTGEFKLYIDGVYNSGGTLSYTYSTAADDYLYMQTPSLEAGTTRYVSEISIYTSVLSSARIAAHYAAI